MTRYQGSIPKRKTGPLPQPTTPMVSAPPPTVPVRGHNSVMSTTSEIMDRERASIFASSNSATVGTTATNPLTSTFDDPFEDESGLEGDENESTLLGPDSKAESVTNVDSNQYLSTKKAQFRKYLIKTGFKNAIIRSFVALYEDKQKPDEPLAWIMGFLGHGIPTSADLEKHRTQAKEIREKIEKLQQENFELRLKIDEREHATQPASLADQQLKKLMDELTESGAFAPIAGMEDENV